MIGKVNVGGGSGGYALEDDVEFTLKPMKDGTGIIKVFFSDPQDTMETNAIWRKTLLVRKDTSVPQTIKDGTVVLTNTTRDLYKEEPFIDTTAETDKQYYYRLFPISKNGIINRNLSPYDNVDNAKKIHIMNENGINGYFFKTLYATYYTESALSPQDVYQYDKNNVQLSKTGMNYSGDYENLTNVTLERETSLIETKNAYRYRSDGGAGAYIVRLKLVFSNLDHTKYDFTKLKITVAVATPEITNMNYSLNIGSEKYTVTSGNIDVTHDERTFSFDVSSVAATAQPNLIFDWTRSIKKVNGSYYGTGTVILQVKAIWLE